jgi:hypothetical protein
VCVRACVRNKVTHALGIRSHAHTNAIQYAKIVVFRDLWYAGPPLLLIRAPPRNCSEGTCSCRLHAPLAIRLSLPEEDVWDWERRASEGLPPCSGEEALQLTSNPTASSRSRDGRRQIAI